MKPSPTTAGQIAKSLAARFLEHGNYEALGIPIGREATLKYAQAAALDAVDEVFGAEEGFAGLAVQSVGYTAGAESEQMVIYVARGSQKELRALPKEVDGVEVTAYVMGKLRAGPTAGMTRSGHFFERAVVLPVAARALPVERVTRVRLKRSSRMARGSSLCPTTMCSRRATTHLLACPSPRRVVTMRVQIAAHRLLFPGTSE